MDVFIEFRGEPEAHPLGVAIDAWITDGKGEHVAHRTLVITPAQADMLAEDTKKAGVLLTQFFTEEVQKYLDAKAAQDKALADAEAAHAIVKPLIEGKKLDMSKAELTAAAADIGNG